MAYRISCSGGMAGDGGYEDTYVNALVRYNGDLVAGGKFISADGIPVNNIARWDGSAWHDMTDGIAQHYTVWPPVCALAVYKGDLIVGGTFDKAGSVDSSFWARWGVPQVYAGDLNHDCVVNINDLMWFTQRWLKNDCLYNGWCDGADLNYDGRVDFADYSRFSGSWGDGWLSPFWKAWLSTAGSPNWHAASDFNNDGQIDFVDFSRLVNSWFSD